MKIGARVLGVVETDVSNDKGVLCGAITTKFLLEDRGFVPISIGGKDATERFFELWELIGRQDVRLVLFSGRIVAGYNLLDLVEIHHRLGIPVAAITYLRPKKRVSEIIRKLFQDAEDRLEIYRKVKAYSMLLNIGGRMRSAIVLGINPKELEAFLNTLLIGKTPFPIYVADRIARGLRRSLRRSKL